jgi:hypothetical protein
MDQSRRKDSIGDKNSPIVSQPCRTDAPELAKNL